MHKLVKAAVVGGAAIAVGVMPAASLAAAATSPTPIPVPAKPTAPVTPGGGSGSVTHSPSHHKAGHSKTGGSKKSHKGRRTHHTGGTGGSGGGRHSGGSGTTHRSPARHPVTHGPVRHRPVTHPPVTHEPVVTKPVPPAPIVHKPVTHKPVGHKPVRRPVVIKPVRKPVFTTPVIAPPVIAPPIIEAPVIGHRTPAHRPIVRGSAQPAMLAAAPGIVGGKTVAKAPWAAQVSWDDTGFECSGAAIAPQWVLTAGHCATSGGMTVLIGSTDLGQGEKAVVDQQVVDPTGDLALLHLTDAVRTTYLPLADRDPRVGSIDQIYGWGKTAEDSGPSDQLKSAKVQVTATDCKDAAGGRAICSTGVTGNAFNGDSGGPEISGGAEVGVCSTGNAQAGTQEYASVAANRDWVRQVTNV